MRPAARAGAAGKAAGPPPPACWAWEGPGVGGLQQSGSGQAGYVSPSPTLAAPSSGRLRPAASGSPGRGRRRRQRPPLTPALLAPHTARSSRAPCARRPSAGGWSCGCTWCPTRGRCPTRSGSTCPWGLGPRGSPRIPPTEPFPWGGVRRPPRQLQGTQTFLPIRCPCTFRLGHRSFPGPCLFPRRAAFYQCILRPGQGASSISGWALPSGPRRAWEWLECLGLWRQVA